MATYIASEAVNRNNLVGAGFGLDAMTGDALSEAPSHFDFGIKWTGADGAVALTTAPIVSLSRTSLSSETFTADRGDALAVEWSLGTLEGTIKETFYSGGVVIAERDNVDPGFGGITLSQNAPDSGRPGPKYSFLLSGTRYEAYVGLMPGVGQLRIASVPAPGEGYPFPLRLAMWAGTNICIRNVQFGGALLPSARYSKDEQIADFGSVQSRVYLSFYQKSKYFPQIKNGIRLNIIAPPITGEMLMESGDRLLTEGGDLLLLE